jgi:dTDP-4-amino-4,6-dideoxygalactose transaminase
MTELGYNYRLTDIQAALGLSQLKRLVKFNARRREVVRRYKEELGGFEKIILPEEMPENKSSWHIYVIRVKNKNNRLPLYTHLLKNGIGVNFHYPAVYSHPYYSNLGYKADCRRAEIYSKTAITLPLHTLLGKKEVDYIVGTIKEFFK